MKQISLAIIIAIIYFGFNACNESADKKTEEASAKNEKSTFTCDGEWILEEAEAKAMIDSFKSIYINKHGLTNLSESVWIDALVIRSFAAFLESPQGRAFDGARFVNGAPVGDNKTILFLVPTKAAPNGVDHSEIWGNGIFSLLEGTPVEFQDYNRTLEYAQSRIDKFESSYRNPTTDPGNTIDSLSTKIWIPGCVFSELKKIIEDPNHAADKITGVRVLFGAYKNRAYRVRGQKYDNQSTVILVPTSSDGVGGNSDRWDIIKSSKPKRKKDAGFNHGELCPNSCN